MVGRPKVQCFIILSLSPQAMVNVIIDQPDCDFYIKYYQDGCVTLNTGLQVTGSMLYFTDQAPQPWPVNSATSLSETNLEPIKSYQPELLILGTGVKQVFPKMSLFIPLQHDGVGVEVMHNKVACQTFNLLADEGRKVLLALIVT